MGFFVGMLIGAALGVICMALLSASSDSDEQAVRFFKLRKKTE